MAHRVRPPILVTSLPRIHSGTIVPPAALPGLFLTEVSDMNRIPALSVLLVAGALHASARADDITIDPTPFVSSASRAEVMGELQQFRQSGIDPWADSYNPTQHFVSERSRADVQADYLRSRDDVSALNGEDSGSVYLARREMARPAGAQLAAASVQAQ